MQQRRADLAAMVVPLGRALVAAELPILGEHGLSMWAYIVLLALDEQPVRTQAALAQAVGADRTRIIGVLDDLQERELIRRDPDPADRRAHLLSLTGKGRRLRDSTQQAIQRQEERWLGRLSATDRRALLRALAVLSQVARDELSRG